MSQQSATKLDIEQPIHANWFKRLGNIFNNNVDKEMTAKTQHRVAISQKIDGFLKNEMLDFVLDIQASGYKFNSEQIKKLDSGFIRAINMDGYTHVKGLNLLAQSIRLNCIKEKYLVEIFFSPHLHTFIVCDREKNSENPLYWQKMSEEQKIVYSLLTEKLKEPIFIRQIYERWVDAIKHTLSMKHHDCPTEYFNSQVLSTFNNLKNHDDRLLFSQSTLDEYLQTISLLEKIPTRPQHLNRKNYNKYHKLVEQNNLDLIVCSMKKNMKTYMAKQTENFTRHAQEVFSVKYLENQTKQASISLAQHVDLSQLSPEVLSILDDIKTKITLVDVNSMEVQTKTHFTNLQQQRLPEILQKYFSIHADYRDSLKDSKGKTPTRLMVEALVDIQEIVNALLLTQQEEKVKDLSIERTMTSEYKKRF